MQVFVCYPEPIKCAEALWNDRLRYNKQCIEVRQILDAIYGVGKGWFNHPVVKMYKHYRDWLECYLYCFENFRDSKKSDNCIDKDVFMIGAEFYSNKADYIRPHFLTNDFCNQHKRRLYTKSPELYPQFEEYGKSDENWYYIDGELLKYKNGKRIKE